MNLTGHNLALLASLSTMLDEKNITRAAAKLAISQPALSAQLARLRDIFGDQLLTPAMSGKGMVLTPRGEHLQKPLRLALQQLEEVVRNAPVFDPTAIDRIFTIAANDNAGAMIAPRLVQVARQKGLRNIRFAFRAIENKRLAEQLESGEVDIALTSKNALPQASQLFLLEEDFRLAQRIGHPRGNSPPTLHEYVQLEHLIVSGNGGGFIGFIDEILAKQKLRRTVCISVQSYSLAPLILQATDLVCTLPSRFVDRYSATIESLELPIEARQFSLYATWHPRFDKDSSHGWLRQMLLQCCAD